ncbi:MAG: hypothetical protein HC838_00600 [Spirulinaceae cyanobacterium RM2_2_10]|nr:hypothetical protein [Spirulinaceae cyanobacterium RM2_2_10]
MLGSANFTEKGITGRTEVSVLFETEPQVEELQAWFESLWSQSSPVRMNEIATYINLLPSQGRMETDRPSIELPSDAPKIRSRLALARQAQEPSRQVIESQDKSSHQRLIEIIRQAPNREWIEEYLDLMHELLDFAKLSNEDPRLVFSLPQSNILKVTINRRQVLTAFRRGEPVVGFLIGHDFEELPQIAPEAVRVWYPKPFPGEIQGQTPYFPYLRGTPKQLLTSNRKTAWKKIVLSELACREASSFRRHHQPSVYKAVTDFSYRSLILDTAFQEINTA